jgi:predicted AlkP superfamily phosphohydrolase/phosphomutase
MLAVLQLDALSFSLVEPMLAEGRLPTLAGLMGRGERRRLASPASHFTGATQPTMYSGIELGQHGQYYILQWAAEEQRVRFRRSFEVAETVWERLARAGRRSLVLDPYEGHPPLRPSGVVASGTQFHNFLGLERWASPPAAARTIDRVAGRRPFVEEIFGDPWVRGLLSLRRRLSGAPRRIADAAIELLQDGPFDLVWITFLATHIGGHQFWDLSQFDEDGLDESTRRILSGTLSDIYEEVDGHLGRLLEALPEDADLIVATPLGMGANTSRADFLDAMVEASLNGAVEPEREASAVWRLRAAVPTSARAMVGRALGPRLTREVMARTSFAGVDWSRTEAFVLPSDHHGQIRLNIRGRERDGIVDPAEAGEVLDRIAAGVPTFRDEDGTVGVGSVTRAEEIVGADAPMRSLLPDLLVHWTDAPATRLQAVESAELGRIERRGHGSGRAGGHTDEAWALLVPGRSRIVPETGEERVVDIAATAAALLGGDMAGLDGTPLLEP